VIQEEMITMQLTRAQIQEQYRQAVDNIQASGEPQHVISMAMNESRRWLDRELDRALPDPVVKEPTLGDKLRASMAEAERLRLSAIERADRQARERAALERQKVHAEFELLKATITTSIEAGSIPAPIRVSAILDNKAKYGVSILNKEHNLYDLWQSEMVSWATQQGLVLTVQHDHDGGGRESWWNLVVKPA
jgi:hypothetical protein